MDDEKIVELYLGRNEAAIKETSLKFGNKLRALSFNIVGNQSDAEECENETYLSAWNSIPPRSPKNYLFTFLAKLTRNISLNLYKKNHCKKRNAIILELSAEIENCLPSSNDMQCKIEDEEFSNIISSFLYELKQGERNVFLRRYWFFNSISQISTCFGMSESKVKSMLFRTRNKLKEYLQKEGYNL